ncbi:thioredoxin domain-containing protein [Arthrobacter sp. Bz4]|uniref:DsbA family protein n=1 Tax=Arthrobacter sp. Bz4 TaxID=2171979 RepID=UPI000D520279|nr:thioredoxin domain-containing protein [Arthrobacter sp. Bz4]PVE14588.1 disulfide bond formation protein DsbA [Arthrobacter sp. Bz4]
MTTPNKIALGFLLLSVFALVGFVVVNNQNNATEQESLATTSQVIRENSHRIPSTGDEKAVLVEFLDFECESCAAAYPLVEDLREEYSDELTFVSRYFPLPGHPNSMTAAIAVEAAAQQGDFEAMYQRMFETQEQWSHSDESQADTFRGYAEELGLDMEAYDRAVEDPATEQRVMLDKNDGTGLGVSGTPTFFLDGQQIQPTTEEEFRQLIEDAIDQ